MFTAANALRAVMLTQGVMRRRLAGTVKPFSHRLQIVNCLGAAQHNTIQHINTFVWH